MKTALDTSAYSALKRGHPFVVDRVRRSEEITLSTIVVGELLFGFRCGSCHRPDVDELEAFLSSPFVRLLPVTDVTADRFGRIAASLRAKGTPIFTNNIWIAAHAFEAGADLISFDQHYRHVGGLAWVEPVTRE
jgi:tRNA(fMet)-specific endonuclease VapC